MLYIVATPIGNLDDVSRRTIQALSSSEIIACEDTRRTRLLLERHQIAGPKTMISYRQGNEEIVGERIIRLLQEGRSVALCSDSGYPGISDPGYRLVRLAVERGFPLTVIPGACAVEVALVLSGLPTSSFTFKGYPPRKAGHLRRFFEQERDSPHTLVIYESPMRLGATLGAAFSALGDRHAAVCLELTKKFERVSRGYISDLAREFSNVKVRGEVTIVIAGNNPKFARGAGPEQAGTEPAAGNVSGT